MINIRIKEFSIFGPFSSLHSRERRKEEMVDWIVLGVPAVFICMVLLKMAQIFMYKAPEA